MHVCFLVSGWNPCVGSRKNITSDRMIVEKQIGYVISDQILQKLFQDVSDLVPDLYF